MKYTKEPLSFSQQISTLKRRGLYFNDEEKAAHYLSNISYYRLRAYTYPFQNNADADHPFIKEVSFEEIIQLYVFDRRLRLLVFNALEKIEIAFRTKIIYYYSQAFGSHFYENAELYRLGDKFNSDMKKLSDEIHRSSEDFIEHYFTKYTEPENPPAWMSLEVASMGLLSQLYKNLKRNVEKRTVAREFGLPREDFLENWMHVFSNLRNTCAHHSRIWNRRFAVEPRLPHDTVNVFLSDKQIHTNKLYATLCCMQYILNCISPDSEFCSNLKLLMKDCPLNQEKEMGFPAEWHKEKLWN